MFQLYGVLNNDSLNDLAGININIDCEDVNVVA